eukprot:1159792-Pelagomonas_calceolata.AAC.6
MVWSSGLLSHEAILHPALKWCGALASSHMRQYSTLLSNDEELWPPLLSLSVLPMSAHVCTLGCCACAHPALWCWTNLWP